MSYTDINAGKRRIDLSHPLAIPTETVERDLRARFPGLEFPYVKQDHVAGVQSNVHAWCEKHQMFTRMSLASARRTLGTKYGCFACANENKGGEGGWHYSAKQYAPGYVGRAGVQSGIFRALKAVYPDTIWEHRMDNGKEIDVYVPSLQFGIEYNGNYYHSTAVGRDDKYHKEKTMLGMAEGKGILHVFTDEVCDDFSKYADYVTDVVKLYAINYKYRNMSTEECRKNLPKPYKCKAKLVPADTAKEFIIKNSLTYLSRPVLDTMDLFVGIYTANRLEAVVYGKPGAILGVAQLSLGVGLWEGIVKFCQFSGRCEYFASLRDPLACLTQELYSWHWGLRLSGTGDEAAYRSIVSSYSPEAYGLDARGNIQPEVEGHPHTIYDCGWVSLRVK